MIIIPDVHGRTFWRQAVNDYLGKALAILCLARLSQLNPFRQ